jgi:hypothetical protein
MYQGLLHTHNLLRWVILIFLLLNIIRHLTAGNQPFNKTDKGLGLPLLIAAHLTLLIGIYQWIVGNWGYNLIKTQGFSAVMKDPVWRFWAVEHMVGMLIAVILITIGRAQARSKHTARVQHKRSLLYFFLALVVILLVVPWPFRDELIRRPWFPGMPLTN